MTGDAVAHWFLMWRLTWWCCGGSWYEDILTQWLQMWLTSFHCGSLVCDVALWLELRYTLAHWLDPLLLIVRRCGFLLVVKTSIFFSQNFVLVLKNILRRGPKLYYFLTPIYNFWFTFKNLVLAAVWNGEAYRQRRRIYTEEKAKVVAAVWGTALRSIAAQRI